MDLTIRELNALDLARGFLETLARLANVGLDPEQARQVFRSRLRAGIHTYIALDSNRVVGTTSLLLEQKFIHRGGRCGHIEDVVVHPEYNGRGVGGALVRHATQRARDLGCYKVILSCFESLVPFYEQLGYQKHDLGMRITF